MPSHKQGTVDAVVTDRALGKSGTNTLRASYATSPMHAGKMTPDSIREKYQKEVLDGVTNDGGHTFGTHNPNYVDAPDMNNVETGGGGLPASPYVPNPVSPGEGSTDPSDQAAAPDSFDGDTPSATPFNGVGSQLSPKASSEAISKQTLGSYGLGKSSS